MTERIIPVFLAGFFLLSCTSVEAKQPPVLEAIDGYSQNPTNATGMQYAGAQDAVARRHQGAITSLAQVPGTSSFFSAGKDGFLVLHTPDGKGDSWQVSDIPVVRIAVHPDGNLVAVYESDGFSVHRVSVWNWKDKTRLNAKRLRDAVLSVSWSARGTWLMVGNTSLDGLTVIEGATGKTISLLKGSPGIVTLAVTGASESSMVTFGPAGRILYTDIASGSTRASYDGQQDLDTPVLLRNNVAIAGYRDGQIILIDATSGKTISSWASDKPVMATATTDRDPSWIDATADGGLVFRTANASSLPFRTPDNSSITVALSLGDLILAGTSSGALYTFPANAAASNSAPPLTAIASKSIQPIKDIVADGSRLFILAGDSVFISPGPGKAPVYAFSGVNADRLTFLSGSLLFWPSKKSGDVVLSGLDGDSRKTVYTAREGIHSLTTNGSNIALVDGTSLAQVIDISTGKVVFSYTGAGLQDAVLIDTGRIAVSRSSTGRAPNPVMLINIATEETVPLQISGDLCYGLKAVAADGLTLAGFLVKAGDVSSTELITFTIARGSFAAENLHTEASYADEDLGASIVVDGNHLLTNLGKGSLARIASGKDDVTAFRFPRDYALPSKAAAMDQFVVTLNLDGTLTWFDKKTGEILSSSEITGNGFWLEQ
jgi:WD40 repeat protein